ncbi:MAG: tRNA uracil 4-sulfurtransferase ThiI [Candidatus Shapirobacteria bacterium]
MDYLIHYGELALKGKNRIFFENKLISNIKQKATEEKIKVKLDRLWGRISLRCAGAKSQKLKTESLLQKTPGIAWFASSFAVNPDFFNFQQAIKEIAQENTFSTFGIRAKIADKKLNFQRKKIEEKLGDWVRINFQKKVDLTKPDLTFYVEILNAKKAFIFSQKQSAPGGLPAGSNGQSLGLLSGGLDSPVAAYLMILRGLKVSFIHFHSYPQTNQASLEKVKTLAKLLNHYQPQSSLYLIPFLKIQKDFYKNCDSRFLVLLYRRAMLNISQKLAEKEGFQALITGDSLGQVASQTIENLALQNKAVKLPILRPLVGLDKEKIISLAKKINSYEISIAPHQDCCSLFVPKNPATRADLVQIEKEEAKLNLKKLTETALKNREEIK